MCLGNFKKSLYMYIQDLKAQNKKIIALHVYQSGMVIAQYKGKWT